MPIDGKKRPAKELASQTKESIQAARVSIHGYVAGLENWMLEYHLEFVAYFDMAVAILWLIWGRRE